jgi:hypothetical protein
MASKRRSSRRDPDLKRPATRVANLDPPHSSPEEEIRRRAYEIFLERGPDPGDELSDWLQAEDELRESRP